jgi:hypothetical protein
MIMNIITHQSLKKIFLGTIILSGLFLRSNPVNAQGNLQFNQAVIVDNNLQTVPANKVWKVEAIYGEAGNFCTYVTCRNPSGEWCKAPVLSGVFVNGILIRSTMSGLTTSSVRYTDNACTQNPASVDISCGNKPPDPNILPLWLPAGTTLQSVGSSCFANVIEFNIVP